MKITRRTNTTLFLRPPAPVPWEDFAETSVHSMMGWGLPTASSPPSRDSRSTPPHPDCFSLSESLNALIYIMECLISACGAVLRQDYLERRGWTCLAVSGSLSQAPSLNHFPGAPALVETTFPRLPCPLALGWVQPMGGISRRSTGGREKPFFCGSSTQQAAFHTAVPQSLWILGTPPVVLGVVEASCCCCWFLGSLTVSCLASQLFYHLCK